MDGRSLEAFVDRLNENGLMFGIDMICHIVAEACTRLSAIHGSSDAPLVHGNLSPRSVFISFAGEVSVLPDDGLASHLRYLSPEQREGRESELTSDIYALGVVLWELLTTKPLETAGEPEPPSKWNPEVPAELDAIAQRALARDADARFRSAGDFRDHLHAFLRAFFPEFNPSHLALQAQELFQNVAGSHTKTIAIEREAPLKLEISDERPLSSGLSYRPDSPKLSVARKRMLKKQIAATDQPSFPLVKTVIAFSLAVAVAIGTYKWYQANAQRVKALASIDNLKALADRATDTKTDTAVEPGVGTIELRHEVAIFDVYLNERKVEPVEGRFTAPAGEPLRISVKRPGYEDILIETELVTAATEVIELHFVKEAPKGFLNLRTVPGTHLSFFKDGKKVFEAYGSIENKTLPVGRYKVVFENKFANHKSEQELVIEQWKTTNVKKDITL